MSVIKSQNDVVPTQLHLYNENKAAFIAAMGKDASNHKNIELFNKLLHAYVVNDPVIGSVSNVMSLVLLILIANNG